MEYSISGDNLQVVRILLEPGEVVLAEAGAMVNMSGNMRMEAKMTGGLLKGIKRVLARESLFLTEFTPSGGSGFVSFAGNVPGRIFVHDAGETPLIAQKDAFLCAAEGVDLDIAFQKRIRAGLFGGEGFILQHISGSGEVFLHCAGDITKIPLAEGETIKVQTGLVVAFEDTVDYSISLTGGAKTILFGGEGLFVTTLTGPGTVILQSLDVAKMAAALAPFLVQETSGESGGFRIGI
ncbi:MAG: TIGR00266 family protein [Methanoculleaceae archaeon]